MMAKPMNGGLRKSNNLEGEIVKSLARLIQIARLYQDNNKLLQDAVNAFQTAVAGASGGEDHVSLRMNHGRFFVQEQRLPLFRKDAQVFNQMLHFFEKRAIYGFHFDARQSRIDAEEIIAFTRLLSNAAGHENPGQWLAAELERENIDWVAVILEETPMMHEKSPVIESDSSQDVERKKAAAKKTYHHALNSVKEVADKLLAGKEAGIRKSVRMVQRMVDIITEDDTTFLALSTIRMYDDYTFTHSLNVALLAMSLGRRVGMKRQTLEKLGLCGLFHDLGKIEIPKSILNKKGKLDDPEYETIKKHSLLSAMLIMKLKADKYRKVHLFVSPFEHHIRYDHSGYPSIDKKRPISMFGRILTIVDVYDAITSPRIYRPTSMSPDQALGLMLSDSGRHYDPVLLKVFVNMLGLYPVGTLLELDTGEIGLALHTPETGDRARPKVQLLHRNGEKNFTKGEIVDLAQRDAKTGDYQRRIVKTGHPASLNIQPAQFIL